MTLGDMSNYREVTGLQPDLQDIAYRDGTFLGVTDIDNQGLAGYAQTGMYNDLMAAVPEPTTGLLTGLALVGLSLRRNRRSNE